MTEHDCYPFPDARLLIFAKAPVPGQVKTRLAGRWGPRGAAERYKKLLRRTLAIANAARLCPIELWAAPDARHGFFIACRRDYGLRLRRQSSGDLGWRMNHALTRTLHQGHPAVLIGADGASLGAAELRQAFQRLTTGADAVLGPAADGGYVLIGLNQPAPALFRNMAWGTSTVLDATRRRLRRMGLNWAELPTGWDVDTPADVRRLRQTQATSAAPKYSAV